MAALVIIPGVLIAVGLIPSGLWLMAIAAVGGVIPSDIGPLLGVAVLLLPPAALATGTCAVLAAAVLDGTPFGQILVVLGKSAALGAAVAAPVQFIGLGVAEWLSTQLGLGLRLGDTFLPAAAVGAAIAVVLPFGIVSIVVGVVGRVARP